ncbi:hypothetical protein [Shewanella sp. GXUN23E]|uniref:hypothetical protein n=1 Tax=Shewanella sp. GXUN23E TaxID=3422498 RepID=UPI003D7E09A6
MKFWLPTILGLLTMIAGMYQIGFMFGYGELSVPRLATAVVGMLGGYLFFQRIKQLPEK